MGSAQSMIKEKKNNNNETSWGVLTKEKILEINSIDAENDVENIKEEKIEKSQEEYIWQKI